MFSSPPAEALPPPVFDDTTSTILGRRAYGSTHSNPRADEEVALPFTPTRFKYFEATVVSPSSESAPVHLSSKSECPRWSAWATSQFTFDYLFMLIMPSMSPEHFKHQHYDEYMETVFQICCIIEAMPDGLFQSFYHLRRLFPNGLIAPHNSVANGGITTVLRRVFALGIAIANLAVYEQRNLNLDWELMCGVLDSHVDGFETAGMQALNWDCFDLAQNRTIYLDWLGHLGYFAEFHYSRTGQTYLRSSADLIAFIHARMFSLPQENQRKHVHPIQLPFLETLSTMLCWDTGLAPLSAQTIQFNSAAAHVPPMSAPGHSGLLRPTAANVLAAVAEECIARLLYPLSAKVKPSPWGTTHCNFPVLIP
ncbi:hypothetical protein C8F04DRAFT_1059555 [Mycena alexandri]|uniref:Uncharacterized protein n=1 Tax=Mycena alexandri TaxID=1745969 RepID=A0AAD6TJR0_9AGAR|nr:hypothetical protein C8F04DRAFT_1059555 [Mycena alexandri]